MCLKSEFSKQKLHCFSFFFFVFCKVFWLAWVFLVLASHKWKQLENKEEVFEMKTSFYILGYEASSVMELFSAYRSGSNDNLSSHKWFCCCFWFFVFVVVGFFGSSWLGNRNVFIKRLVPPTRCTDNGEGIHKVPPGSHVLQWRLLACPARQWNPRLFSDLKTPVLYRGHSFLLLTCSLESETLVKETEGVNDISCTSKYTCVK